MTKRRKQNIAKKIDGRFIAFALAGVVLLAMFLFSPLIKGKMQWLGGGKTETAAIDFEALAKPVVPPEGISTNAEWGCPGKKLVETGAINLEKFKKLYENYGNPLTEEQLEILTSCTDKTLK